MIRIVLDTNVLVSALLNRHGAPAQVLRMILQDPEMQLYISGEVYAEYDEILRRPKLKRSKAEIDGRDAREGFLGETRGRSSGVYRSR